ncbi:MFS transporter [Rubinisphaera margarita]|uniref:MFS transporter n=1 Tax=Rubinisphaera margarita TaxID=2909586 RepID=UPI001EE84E3A|nr:MFS transporter [Rubinisphaera margarita]MCG6158219.1 MFS transporter [Rubinisphaera margarita]
MTLVRWLVCATAAVGFAFDTYELLMLPLVLRPALQELIGASPGSPEFQMWLGRLFFIPAFAGGIFGLLGGWLTDRFGRRRVLAGSIFLYAGAAFVSGYSTSVEMLLFCRCLVFIGVCVEFVAAIAWLSELFDDPKLREAVIGYTQAFASVGGLLVALVNSWLASMATDGQLPSMPLLGTMASLFGEVGDPNAVWRYTLMSGLLPAIPLVIVRPFLPESPKWKERKQAGTLGRPSITELFTPALRRTTIVTTLLVGASFGLAFGGLQQIPQMVPNLPEVKAAAAELPPDKARAYQQKAAAEYTKVQEIGGLTGRIALATLAVMIISRRGLLAFFAIPALFVLPYLFYQMAGGNSTFYGEFLTLPLSSISFWVFLGGFFVVGQFSFWGNYLPRVFPLHLRGTGESMAANVGGRMLGTSFAWITTNLAATSLIPGQPGPEKMGYAAAIVTLALAVVLVILLWALKEPGTTDEG